MVDRRGKDLEGANAASPWRSEASLTSPVGAALAFALVVAFAAVEKRSLVGSISRRKNPVMPLRVPVVTLLLESTRGGVGDRLGGLAGLAAGAAAAGLDVAAAAAWPATGGRWLRVGCLVDLGRLVAAVVGGAQLRAARAELRVGEPGLFLEVALVFALVAGERLVEVLVGAHQGVLVHAGVPAA
jgi:hypothetical protein